jgi:chemotaxis protein MotB
MKNVLIAAMAGVLALSSCVPQRKFAEMESKKNTCEKDLEGMKKSNELLEAGNKDLQNKLKGQDDQIRELTADTAQFGKEYRQLKTQYDKINELNDILSKKSSELLSQATGENKKLVEELNRTQESLQKKEDMLKDLEKDLNEKQAAIDKTNAELAEKQKRLSDLEKLLADQQASSEALKNKVQAALLGFKDKGLTVSEKDGKVYVSMEAQLLFATGSTVVDPKGKKALVDLAKAIENDTDMEVLVEGHTDTDKLSAPAYPKDNWDLSVLRATEVVKIILANSNVQPQILSAAGRSEFHPVDSADKSKNRRIEIILQPKLDELYKLIEGPQN